MQKLIYRGFNVCDNGSKAIIQNDKKYFGEWITSDCITTGYGATFLLEYCIGWKFVTKETIGLHTNKKDKNGKDIYVGDILRIKLIDSPEKYRLALVKFGEYYDDCASDSFIGFYCKTEGVEISFYQDNGEWLKNAEVIGNEYENPELLKEVK